MWANACSKVIKVCPSINDGWMQTEVAYEPIWHDGPQLPPSMRVDDNMGENENEEGLVMEETSDEELSEGEEE